MCLVSFLLWVDMNREMCRLQRRVEENDTVWEGRLETVKQQHKEQASQHTPLPSCGSERALLTSVYTCMLVIFLYLMYMLNLTLTLCVSNSMDVLLCVYVAVN